MRTKTPTLFADLEDGMTERPAERTPALRLPVYTLALDASAGVVPRDTAG